MNDYEQLAEQAQNALWLVEGLPINDDEDQKLASDAEEALQALVAQAKEKA